MGNVINAAFAEKIAEIEPKDINILLTLIVMCVEALKILWFKFFGRDRL